MSRPLPLLTKLGVCELAVGVLSGWAMVAMVESAEGLKRLGVLQPHRIRQTHLELLMQGTILIAVGAAVQMNVKSSPRFAPPLQQFQWRR